MTPDATWSRAAATDLDEIVAYVAARDPDAADRLRDRVLGKTAALRGRTGLYRRGRVNGTREMVVHRNYVVVYAVRNGQPFILRVLHAARRWP